MIFEKLRDWQEATGTNDTALAELVGVVQTTISRAKTGQRELSTETKLKLQNITGITPEEWAAFEARVVLARTKPRGRTEKKSVAGAEA